MKTIQRILILTILLVTGLLVSGQQSLNYTYKKGYLIVEIPSNDSEIIRDWEEFTSIPKSHYDSLRAQSADGNFATMGWSFYAKKGINYSKKKLKELDFNRLLRFNICDENIPMDKTKKYERFGVNYFVEGTSPTYQDGLCTFSLPGYENAKKVILAGSFNQWSTTQDKMKKTDSGWRLTLPLEADKYEYKYIVDGKWMLDPNNRRAEGDGYGNTNSVLFLPNHKFILKGSTNAKVVSVIGNFNDWNLPGVPMNRMDGGWDLDILLHDGAIEYQYVIDGEIVTDPKDPNPRSEASGRIYSTFSIGPVREFNLDAFPNAKEVRITGIFTDWSETGVFMRRTNGQWNAIIPVQEGNYEYKLIVDGEWTPDPTNPHQSGQKPFVNSVMSIDPNHTFFLKGSLDAKEVIVTGTFNHWQETGYVMDKASDGWKMDVFLPEGKTRYKFKVDGKWGPDPANPLWERNQFDTKDSILWME